MRQMNELPEKYDVANIRKRFFSKVIPVTECGCWLWTGNSLPLGYGHLRVGTKVYKAHRISWFLHTGDFPPPSIIVCHACDVPACVNPAHLFLGSHQDNHDDMHKKNRDGCTGEKNPKAKINMQQVLDIIKTYRNPCSIADLALKYGISKQQIWRIVAGKSWRRALARERCTVTEEDIDRMLRERGIANGKDDY